MSKQITHRNRLMTSLPSQRFSVSDLMIQNDGNLKTSLSKRALKNREFDEKQQQIKKLKRNLQSAVSTAINQRLQSSKASRQFMFANQSKVFLTNKITNLEASLLQKDKQIEKLQLYNQNVEKQLQNCKIQNENMSKNIINMSVEHNQVKIKLKQIGKLNKRLQNITNMQQRIKALQYQLREQKLKFKQLQKKYFQLENDKKKLIEELLNKKPIEEQLKQRILLLERICLDLERKQQDQHRRENELLKEKQILKNNLHKITLERNHFKESFQRTAKHLSQSKIQCASLTLNLQNKNQQFLKTSSLLEQQKNKTSDLQMQMKNTIQFFQVQTQENAVLKKKNFLIDQHNIEMKNTISHYIKVAEEVNLFITHITSQNTQLKMSNSELQSKLEQTQQKFEKFNIQIDPNSEKGKMLINESIYQLIRTKNKLQIEIKSLKQDQNQKFLKFGEQRDSLVKKLSILTIPIPTEQIPYDVLLYQKSEQIILVENSNEQLIKIKKELYDKQQQLKEALKNEKIQCYNLRLKATQFFQTKKQLEKTTRTNKRLQSIIQQQREKLEDNRFQRQIFRQKISAAEDKKLKVELHNQSLNLRIKELENKIKQLDVELLEGEKAKNQKNQLLLNDALERIEKGISTLHFFFSCSFCGQIPVNPVTLANCGHNYCQKCQQGYNEQCHECENGQNIQKVFQNKYLKECTGKYKYLCIVVKQLKANFTKKI